MTEKSNMVSLFDVAEAIFRHAEKMDGIGRPNAAAACRLLAMEFEDKARNGGAIAPPSAEGRVAEGYYQRRRANLAEDTLQKALEALRMFYGCAYPVATEINPRGWNWRGERALDEALLHASVVLQDPQRMLISRADDAEGLS